MSSIECSSISCGVPVTRTGPMRIPGTVGFIQPFRYRGYVWDEETGMYYLRSRYYRPSWGRFISADAKIHGNVYCYCNNSPVLFADHNGFTAFFAADDVQIQKRPYASDAVYLVQNKGAECTVLFPVYDSHRDIKYYFISYESPTLNQTVIGYVSATDLVVTDENFELPDISALNRDITIGRRSHYTKSYDVYVLQCVLYEYGFLDHIWDIDGVYGETTQRAVFEFQNQYNQWVGTHSDEEIDYDGLYGEHTYDALCVWAESHDRVR